MAINARMAVLAAAAILAGCASAPLQRFPSASTEGVPDSVTTLYVPQAAGPHPAIVLLPTCGGIGRSFQHWSSFLVREGYVVLALDSFGPRGVRNVCDSLAVSVDQVAADALAAANHLRRLPFVDPRRVYGMGFSYGGMALLRTASAGYLARQANAAPFRAIAAFYPHCHPRPGAGAAAAEAQHNLYPDIATPLHLLLGGADVESPAALCTEHAERLRAAGRPISYTMFPDATHGFDFGSPERGYRYDAGAVLRAEREVVAFFGKSR